MKHRFAASAVGAGLLIGLSVGPASAARPETTTTHAKHLVETFVDVVPTCEGGGDDAYTITTTTNIVEHTTEFADGRIHATFTQTGTFVAVPLDDPSLPEFTGKITAWGNFNQTARTVNSTNTFTVHGTGDDGSTFKHHETQHFNARPNGSTNEFFHCNDN